MRCMNDGLVIDIVHKLEYNLLKRKNKMQPDEKTQLFLDLAKEVRESIKRDELGTRMKVTLPLFDGLVQTLENMMIKPEENDDAVKLQSGEQIQITHPSYKTIQYRVILSPKGVTLINEPTYSLFSETIIDANTRGELRKKIGTGYTITFLNKK